MKRIFAGAALLIALVVLIKLAFKPSGPIGSASWATATPPRLAAPARGGYA
jgi:hypothetical protein